MKKRIKNKRRNYKQYSSEDKIKNHKKSSAIRSRRKKRKKEKMLIRLMLIISMTLILASAGGLFIYWCHLSVQSNKLNELADKVEQVLVIENSGSDNSMISKYEEIYKDNPDLFGWIKIDDTRIDYPVMQTPEDPEKYLRTNFEEKYSHAGLPFVDEECTKDSDNIIIYAHNMKDGSMFQTLFKYKKEKYWKEHPIIQFDTLYDEQEYEVLAVFYDRVYYKHEDVFKFYQFINAEDEADYKDAIKNYKEKQLYDTGVEAEYGDQLITLVTCSYHEDNGRFVVVARKITE